MLRHVAPGVQRGAPHRYFFLQFHFTHDQHSPAAPVEPLLQPGEGGHQGLGHAELAHEPLLVVAPQPGGHQRLPGETPHQDLETQDSLQSNIRLAPAPARPHLDADVREGRHGVPGVPVGVLAGEVGGELVGEDLPAGEVAAHQGLAHVLQLPHAAKSVGLRYLTQWQCAGDTCCYY